MIYSKEEEVNLEQRINLIKNASKDVKVQETLKQIFAEDILAFFNLALWTYDPRSSDKKIPFITYPFQDDYLLWLDKIYKTPEDGLTEKSRDMGVSWMILGFLLHKWLFEKGFNALIGSYIEDLVDNKTMDSHFGRLRFLINNLPEFLYPEKNNDSKNVYMRLENKINGNSIVGYAPTDNFSRQGRYSVIWADEFAFWQRGRTAWTAMGDASKCRLVSSTPNGKGNKFADLALKSKISKQTLHWRLHPLKTEQWYQDECSRRTPEEIAQELDINYNKSVIGRVYPEFCERNYDEVQAYNPTQPLYVAWDFGLDAVAMIWLQVDQKDYTVRIIDSYTNSNKTIDFYVPFITGEIKTIQGIPGYEYSDEEYIKIQKHRNWQPAIHYGDPTGSNRDRARGTSWIADLRKYGITVNTNPSEFDLKTRIHKTKLLIRRLVVDKSLTDFIDAMENCRYPDRGEDSQSTAPIDKPIHDWTSHYRTALEYYAVNEKVRGEKKATVITPSRRPPEKKKFSNPSYRPAC